LRRAADFHYRARRPCYSALGSKRAILLPPLESALARFIDMRAEPAELEERMFFADSRHVPGTERRQAS